jgi:3-hydroxyacyl-CoA dehydrogenase/enoyl-CoA hydratase/3-hydroxybutyryl-CoA epimerase
MNELYGRSMEEAVTRLEAERDSITGVVITSAKKTFFAGGNLNELVRLQPQDAPRFTAHLDGIKAQLRTLETLGVPVVAAINGAAMGGGLELALATHHRVLADVRGAQVGLPEVNLGLLPGCGGIVRVVRMLGVATALEKVLLSGARFSPADALQLGLVDEVVTRAEDLLQAASESGSPPTWSRSSPGTARATRSPAAPPPRVPSRRSCRTCPPTCAVSSAGLRLPRSGRSWPPLSRVPRSMQTPPR